MLSQIHDATTIFPDHVAARPTAIAALAARSTGTAPGRWHVDVPQAEAAVSQLTTADVAEAARTAGLR